MTDFRKPESKPRLPEEKPAPYEHRWSRLLFPYRWLLLAAYVVTIVCCHLMLTNNQPLRFEVPVGYVIGGNLLLFAVQGAFLCGAPHWRWPRPTHKRALRISVAAGAFIAALLTLGMVATLISFLRAEATVNRIEQVLDQGVGRPPIDIPWIAFMFVAPAWLAWFLLFGLLWAGQPLTLYRRMYRTLLAGTCLEVLITIPVDVQVRKRTNCYCGEGTFAALIIGITTAVWAFGPGIVLLFLARRMQRRTDLRVCLRCGYDLRGLSEPRCPECGLAFTTKATHS